MKMRLLIVSVSIAVSFLGYTLAHGQTAGEATKKKPVAAASKPATIASKPVTVATRTAACKLDCSSDSLHGFYRAYGTSDPQLKSPEGQKLYAECVQLCLDPLPGWYFQKSTIESGGSWLGKRKADCLGCHAVGNPKRNWPGINTQPDSLRRTSTQ